MLNFMGAGMLVLDDKAPYVITYTESETEFKMFSRKMK